MSDMKNKKAGKFDTFLASRSGKIFFNRVYSWGAAVVIVGALFKILHWPYGSLILMIGMFVEAFVFFISGFDNPALREDDERVSKSNDGVQGSTQMFSPDYAEKMTLAAGNMDEFSKIMTSLNTVSASLLNSYQQMSTYSESMSSDNDKFAENIKGLNTNAAQLNAIYESQLTCVAGQIESVKYINDSLDRIKSLYDGSIADSTAFRAESEKMTKQIESLNQVYARLLQAMTSSSAPLNS